jgi:ParB family chromosome partitioning protein
MLVIDITTRSPFKDLFPIRENILNEIVKDIQENGFDKSKPIALWRRCGLTVVDGHTRLRAAEIAKLKDVPTVMKEFPDERAALEYAIKCQRNRRNLTEQELLQCISELDKKKTAGRPRKEKLAPCGASLGKSSNETASILGVSTRKVERARAVLDKAPAEIKEAVKSGKMSINAAYNKTVNPEKGSPESLRKAEKEIGNVKKVLTIIKKRLSQEQIRELIKLLQDEDVNQQKESV